MSVCLSVRPSVCLSVVIDEVLLGVSCGTVLLYLGSEGGSVSLVLDEIFL